VKKLRGKDVPELEGEIPKEVEGIFDATKVLIGKGALALIDEVTERAWKNMAQFSPEGLIVKDAFEATAKALKDAIREECEL